MAADLPEGQTLFTLAEVARHLKVTTWTLRRWIRRGELHAHKVGKQWRVRREEVERLLSGSQDVPARDDFP
jgi:putative resolvase